ncbi:MAG: lysophospholipid acyltransferase family protein [Vicinamibacteria bacterium]
MQTPFFSKALRELNGELEDRFKKLPSRLNSYGYDPWGMNPRSARGGLLIFGLLYRYYFRVSNFGLANLPPGGFLLIGNHSGQIALDAAMIAMACLLEARPPRIVRGMGEYWLPSVPFLSVFMHRYGSVVGTPENCLKLLARGECVIVMPEGVRGTNKLFSERYKLQRFGPGFMRMALEARVPIVPVSLIGAEEQAPGLANLKRVGKLLGMPAFPVTLTWPHLGPLGLIPFPVKYRIYFGEPMTFDGDPNAEDKEIQPKVDRVRAAIEAGLRRGLAERRHIFW